MKKNKMNDDINNLKDPAPGESSGVQSAPAPQESAVKEEIKNTENKTPAPNGQIPGAAASQEPADTAPAENELPDSAADKKKKKTPSFISAFTNKVRSFYTAPENAENTAVSGQTGAPGTEVQENAPAAAVKKAKNKKLIIGVSAAALIVIAAVIIIICLTVSGKPDGTAYVTPVSELNTAVKPISGNRFSGVVESQKTFDIKLESDKSIKEVLVGEGDSVEEGDELFLYDVEAMKLELENGELEIESLENEIDSIKRQISELEDEKESAGKENKLSYTTQIQSLKTDIEKIEYDIKVKNNSQEKLSEAIDNSVMTAPSSGTVKSLKTLNQMTEEGTDVIMTIVADGDFRVKGRINEQNIGSIIEGDSVIIRSRVNDSAVWKGMVTEISNEPESNNNMMYGYDMGDSESVSSNYAFYITPESIEGLMLGQHVLIEPDTGMNSEIEKDGIWLYEDYIVDIDTDEPYVWAVDNFGRLEKRAVEIGEKDEDNGDVEISSGLDNDDLIAYPSDDYEEGMKTSNKADEELDTELNGGEDNEFMPDGGEFDENMDFGDMEYDEDMDLGGIGSDDDAVPDDFGDFDFGDMDIDDSEVEQ